MPKDFQFEVASDDLHPEVRRLVAQAAWAAARDATNRVPAHNYGRAGNGEKALLKIIVGVLVGLLTAAGIGFWSIYGEMSSVSQKVTDYHAQDSQNSERNHQDIQAINQLLEHRYGQ